MIHAAKIDEQYSSNEEEIIKKTLLKFEAKSNDLIKIINEAKEIEGKFKSNSFIYKVKICLRMIK